jgi:hypothetical protein
MLAVMIIGSALLAGLPALAQESDPDGFAKRHPPASITSVEQADVALLDARQTRAALTARHTRQEAACYPRFFVSNCLEQAAEALRRGLAVVRPVEVEAERFKRQASVNEHDKAMAERRAQEQANAPQRLIEQQEAEAAQAKRVAEHEAGAARAEADAKLVAEREAAARQKSAEREQQHLAKSKKDQAKQAARAAQEAANIEAYHKKQQAAKERQQASEQKQQEREAKQKAREAAASASAAASAPSAASPKP